MPAIQKPDQALIDLIVRSASMDTNVAFAAQRELALALQEPLREGVLSGDVLGNNIYQRMELAPGATPEFPLDILAPGTEDEHIAYTAPNEGRIPENMVQGDYIMVPTFTIANSIDWLLHFAAEARWDIVARAMQVMEAGFVKKLNDAGWHTILGAAADRNVVVYDADAQAGQFTKRLISLMKVVMRRNGGGNSTSLKRGELTDVYMSPEAEEDIRNWNVDQVDEMTRRDIFISEGGIPRIFNVNLHSMDELGEGQEYQLFLTAQLNASVASGDLEFLVGLDLSKNDSFVMPIKQAITIFDDPALHRFQKAGFYGWGRQGFAALDGRRVILGSM